MISHLGGEFYYTLSNLLPSTVSVPRSFENENEYPYVALTGGGYYSLKWILAGLQEQHGNLRVLLPSYLCPSILNAFTDMGMEVDFFNVRRDLTVDENDVLAKVGSIDCFYFINYFGQSFARFHPGLFRELQKAGKQVIEDDVQASLSRFRRNGDFIFNSFKKLSPVEGSVIHSRTSLSNSVKFQTNAKYLRKRNLGKLARYGHYAFHLPTERIALRLFGEAERYYYQDGIISMSKFQKYLMHRWRWEHEREIRKKNFRHLAKRLGKIGLLQEFQVDETPLSFPVVVSDRDHRRKKLIRKRIFCPVHWQLDDSIVPKKNHEDSYWLSSHILSVPINKPISKDQFQILEEILLD